MALTQEQRGQYARDLMQEDPSLDFALALAMVDEMEMNGAFETITDEEKDTDMDDWEDSVPWEVDDTETPVETAVESDEFPWEIDDTVQEVDEDAVPWEVDDTVPVEEPVVQEEVVSPVPTEELYAPVATDYFDYAKTHGYTTTKENDPTPVPKSQVVQPWDSMTSTTMDAVRYAKPEEVVLGTKKDGTPFTMADQIAFEERHKARADELRPEIPESPQEIAQDKKEDLAEDAYKAMYDTDKKSVWEDVTFDEKDLMQAPESGKGTLLKDFMEESIIDRMMETGEDYDTAFKSVNDKYMRSGGQALASVIAAPVVGSSVVANVLLDVGVGAAVDEYTGKGASVAAATEDAIYSTVGGLFGKAVGKIGGKTAKGDTDIVPQSVKDLNDLALKTDEVVEAAQKRAANAADVAEADEIIYQASQTKVGEFNGEAIKAADILIARDKANVLSEMNVSGNKVKDAFNFGSARVGTKSLSDQFNSPTMKGLLNESLTRSEKLGKVMKEVDSSTGLPVSEVIGLRAVGLDATRKEAAARQADTFLEELRAFIPETEVEKEAVKSMTDSLKKMKSGKIDEAEGISKGLRQDLSAAKKEAVELDDATAVEMIDDLFRMNRDVQTLRKTVENIPEQSKWSVLADRLGVPAAVAVGAQVFGGVAGGVSAQIAGAAAAGRFGVNWATTTATKKRLQEVARALGAELKISPEVEAMLKRGEKMGVVVGAMTGKAEKDRK